MKLWQLPGLDACPGSVLMVSVTTQACKGAIPEDPDRCAISRALGHGGIEARVYRTSAWVRMRADRELIAHNRKANPARVKDIKVGQEVRVRFVPTKNTRREIAKFDDGNGFPEAFIKLIAPGHGDAVDRKTRRAGKHETRHRRGTPASTRPQIRTRATTAHRRDMEEMGTPSTTG